jgi:hypothetical protein
MAEVQGRGLQTISPETLLANHRPGGRCDRVRIRDRPGKDFPTPPGDGEQYGDRGSEVCHGSSIAVAFTFNGG